MDDTPGPAIEGASKIALVFVTQLIGNLDNTCVRILKHFACHTCTRLVDDTGVRRLPVNNRCCRVRVLVFASSLA